MIPQIARGFAGGIGNTGAVCGAVAGGVMAIGLARERVGELADTLDELGLVAEFRRRFEAEMGSIRCRELTGLDLTDRDEVELLIQSDIPERVCMPAVNVATRIALELLDGAGPGD